MSRVSSASFSIEDISVPTGGTDLPLLKAQQRCLLFASLCSEHAVSEELLWLVSSIHIACEIHTRFIATSIILQLAQGSVRACRKFSNPRQVKHWSCTSSSSIRVWQNKQLSILPWNIRGWKSSTGYKFAHLGYGSVLRTQSYNKSNTWITCY